MEKNKSLDKEKRVILYVDDEQNNLNVFLAHFRRKENYVIITAKSAEEGLKVLKVVAVQIVVADQKMPSMTGVEFLEEIIQKPVPVKIVVTAHRDSSVIERAFQEGKIFKYHDKPWNLDELEKTIEEAYQIYRQKA